MSISLNFGDVFSYKEKEYVFLTKTSEGILFVAEILDRQASKRLDDTCRTLSLSNRSKYALDKPIFCYIILQTKDFEGRAAHLLESTRGGRDISQQDQFYERIICSLIKEDLREIKKEIESGPVSLLLKELVRDIDLS